MRPRPYLIIANGGIIIVRSCYSHGLHTALRIVAAHDTIDLNTRIQKDNHMPTRKHIHTHAITHAYRHIAWA